MRSGKWEMVSMRIREIQAELRVPKPKKDRKVGQRRLGKKNKIHPDIVYGGYIEELLATKFQEDGSLSHPGTIAASMLGSGARLMFLKYTGQLVGSYNLSSHRYMSNGNSAGLRWEEDMKALGILVSAEEKYAHPTLPIRGRSDLVVTHPEKEKLLIELKTTGEKVKEWKEPTREHIAQWTFYSDMSGIESGWIIYENRLTVEPYYFPLHRRGKDIYIFSFAGEPQQVLKGYVDELYTKVEFAIWCANNGKFPKDKCPECVQWGCKQPDICMIQEAGNELISQEDWEKNHKKEAKIE